MSFFNKLRSHSCAVSDTWSAKLTMTGISGGNRISSALHVGETHIGVGGSFNSGNIYTSSNGVTWQSVYSASVSFRGIAYGNGLYVAVGQDQTIVTSTDLVTWTSRRSVAGTTLIFVKYINGIFIAGGENGLLVTSSDGMSWSQKTTGTTRSLYDATHGNGVYVVVGFYGTVLSSSDSNTWTARPVTIAGSASSMLFDCYNVAFNAGIFCIAPYGGANNEVYCSTDGATWSGYRVSSLGRNSGLIAAFGLFIMHHSSRGIIVSVDPRSDYAWQYISTSQSTLKTTLQNSFSFIYNSHSKIYVFGSDFAANNQPMFYSPA